MNEVILISITEKKLSELIEKSVTNAIKELEKSEPEKLLTTAEVSKLFGVSNVTISSWIKKGLLPMHSMGGRNYFKKSEVLDSLKTLKKYKLPK